MPSPATRRVRPRASRSGRLERLRDPLTKRTVLRGRSQAGTDLWVAPMSGFRKSYAVITTRYGSLDTHLPDGTRLPDGLAHFLEHKMFQTEAGDVFDLYASRGASANAFTTFGHTSYLFASTHGFLENLDILLDSLAAIQADEEGVAREKGIIGQEIAMYDDDAGWRGFFNLLQALYRRHPVRVDIAGTAETIAPIDPAILRRTHAAFYHPRNLVLAVAGDVEASAVLERLEARLPGTGRGRLNRRPPVSEPRAVRRREVRQQLSVSRPHVVLGLKDRAPGGGLRLLRQRVLTAMGLNVLFGDGGRIQAPLYREGLVDDSFGAAYECERDFAFATVSAEVDQEAVYRRRLLAELRRAAADGVSEAEVERTRRRFLGRHLRTFNAPERLAHWMLGAALEQTPLGAGVEAVRSASAQGIARRLRALAAAPHAFSIIDPAAS